MATPKFTKKTTKDGKSYTHVELIGDPREVGQATRAKAREASTELSAAASRGRMTSEINAEMERDPRSAVRESEMFDGRTRSPTFSEEDILNSLKRVRQAQQTVIPQKPPSRDKSSDSPNLGELASQVAGQGKKPEFSHSQRGSNPKRR